MFYFPGTIRQFPAEVQIIDCRYGLMLLKFGKDEVKFCICSPFQRNSWIVLPQHDIQTDQIMAGALIHDTETGIRLVLVCLDKSAEGSYLPLVVKVFSSATRRWTRVQQLLCFRAGESVLPHGVHCGRFVHFLSKMRRQILKVDPVNLTTGMPRGYFIRVSMSYGIVPKLLCYSHAHLIAFSLADVINLPKRAFPQMALTKVGGELCFSTVERRQILTSRTETITGSCAGHTKHPQKLIGQSLLVQAMKTGF